MSEASYQLNVARSVTGPNTNTCLLAAYDRISTAHDVRPDTYALYNDLWYNFHETVDDEKYVSPSMISAIAVVTKRYRQDLGVHTSRNVLHHNIETESELRNTLARLAIGGFRTAVFLDVGGLHAVGLLHVGDDEYNVKSTWSPFGTDESVTTRQVYGYLYRGQRDRKRPGNCRKTVKACNLVSLPPESAN